ncbi:hypothetical protein K438DRAFT_1976101 [Mycena galopus ATCC 62051]|nr:hypothetical protein K438DRAFT_1976101 [Mycena galopus ATCC 62051]
MGICSASSEENCFRCLFYSPGNGARPLAIRLPFDRQNVYDDCDTPLDVDSDLLISGGSAIGTNFSVDENGGITRSGSAEDVDAESESESEVQSVAPAVLGRGQRKKIVAKRYQGPIWEEH